MEIDSNSLSPSGDILFSIHTVWLRGPGCRRAQSRRCRSATRAARSPLGGPCRTTAAARAPQTGPPFDLQPLRLAQLRPSARPRGARVLGRPADTSFPRLTRLRPARPRPEELLPAAPTRERRAAAAAAGDARERRLGGSRSCAAACS